MSKWSHDEVGKGFGPKVTTGYYLVGKPFAMVKGFREMPWGLVSAIVTGTVKDVLPYEVGAEKEVADREWVGETIGFFLAHPVSHYSIEDGIYQYLDRRTFKEGGFESNYWLEWLLAKAGFSTKGLETGDDDLLERQILALLNASDQPFPVCIFNGRPGMIGKQIPRHTKLLGRFLKLQYFDYDTSRPTWMEYEHEGERGLSTRRDVEFLLQVVAPEPWTNTIAQVRANYTILRGEEGWTKTHTKATFDTWCSTLGVDVKDFVLDLPDSLLEEVEVWGYPNLLGPLEKALQRQAEMGRLLKIIVNDSGNIRRSCVQGAAGLDITGISGQKDFVRSEPLRSIDDIDEKLYEEVAEEPIPGFDDEPLTDEMNVSSIMKQVDNWAGITVWKSRDEITPGGEKWAIKYLVLLFDALGMDRGSPFSGWTQERRAKMAMALVDETYMEACERPEQEQDKEALTEYLTNLWAEDEPVENGNGAAF